MQPENDNWQPPQPQSSDAPRSVAAPENNALRAPEASSDDVGNQSPEQNPELVDRAPIAEDQVVRWQASEYIYRPKNATWYGVFALVVVGLMLLAIFAFRSVTFAILIPVMAAALVMYSRRPPAQLEYTLSRKGLHIDDKLYPYEQFKEFGLIHGDDQFSVMLVPRERFKPGVTVYFPEETGEAVVDMLAARLPMNNITIDPIDRFIRMLRI